MIDDIIQRYKQLRNLRMLRQTVDGQYAFVGIGNHSISNLYPVLDYLHIPLKYICCQSNGKLPLIERQWRTVHATTRLNEILADDSVQGVFVSAAPTAHFDIARQVLGNGKALFIEKPPCHSLAELQQLMELEQAAATVTAVGMQKRHAPATRILAKRLKDETMLTYNMKYLTGNYPEGDAITDLFIHPLDYVCHLFGKAEVCCCEHIRGKGGTTLLLTLRHKTITGILELSTAYSWQHATEVLAINTERGTYALEEMETLIFTPKQGLLLGVPLEKVMHRNTYTEVLFTRNNFVPTVVNNQLYTQGYLDEIKTFVEAVQSSIRPAHPYGFCSMYDTYSLMTAINERLKS